MHDYRWIDSADGAFLHWGYVCVAVVRPDGTVRITGWGRAVGAKAASREQGKRFVDRWRAGKGMPVRRR
jgi:hypothetical protein